MDARVVQRLVGHLMLDDGLVDAIAIRLPPGVEPLDLLAQRLDLLLGLTSGQPDLPAVAVGHVHVGRIAAQRFDRLLHSDDAVACRLDPGVQLADLGVIVDVEECRAVGPLEIKTVRAAGVESEAIGVPGVIRRLVEEDHLQPTVKGTDGKAAVLTEPRDRIVCQLEPG